MEREVSGGMIKIVNQHEIYNLVRTGIWQTITDHGVIHRKLVDSATKRIMGNIKSHLYNLQVERVRLVRKTPFTNA